MVGQARVSVAYQHERIFDMGSLRRLAVWGGAAAFALLLAVVASYSDANDRRLLAADAEKEKTGAPPAQLTSRLPEIDAQTQRLAAVMDGLTAERERLTARIGTIERNLEDVTGAIKRQARDPVGAPSAALPAPASSTSAPAPVLAVPTAREPAKEATREALKEPPKEEVNKETAMLPPATLAAIPARQPTAAAEVQPREPEAAARSEEVAASEPPARIDFGIDVGGALNFDGLRVLWASTKGNNAALFEGLHPLVAVRENSRTKNAELRLVVGPLANVEGAARLCASLSTARRYCQPVAFEGQRLTEPDVLPERRAAPAAPKPKVAAPAPAPPKPRGLGLFP